MVDRLIATPCELPHARARFSGKTLLSLRNPVRKSRTACQLRCRRAEVMKMVKLRWLGFAASSVGSVLMARPRLLFVLIAVAIAAVLGACDFGNDPAGGIFSI
jgi:hypothetical protein